MVTRALAHAQRGTTTKVVNVTRRYDNTLGWGAHIIGTAVGKESNVPGRHDPRNKPGTGGALLLSMAMGRLLFQVPTSHGARMKCNGDSLWGLRG